MLLCMKTLVYSLQDTLSCLWYCTVQAEKPLYNNNIHDFMHYFIPEVYTNFPPSGCDGDDAEEDDTDSPEHSSLLS